MNKGKSFINENKGKIIATVGTVATLGPISAFAEETPSISATISTSMQTIVTDTIANYGSCCSNWNYYFWRCFLLEER